MVVYTIDQRIDDELAILFNKVGDVAENSTIERNVSLTWS